MKKNYWDLFEEGMVGAYFLRVDFSACYWVQIIDFYGTMFYLSISIVFKQYRLRPLWYSLVFVYFIFPRFFKKFNKEYDYTYTQPFDERTELSVIIKIYIPIFLAAVVFADIESFKTWRPLDTIRNLHWGWKIPLNFVFLFLFAVCGSAQPEEIASLYTPRQ